MAQSTDSPETADASPSREVRIRPGWRELACGKYTFLLLALIALAFVYPLLAHVLDAQLLAAALLTTVLLAGTYVVGRTRRLLIAAILLVCVTIGLLWFETLFADRNMLGRILEFSSQSAAAMFLGFVLCVVLSKVLSESNVSLDTINGATCAYILLGLTFALLYSIVESAAPGSFDVNPAHSSGRGASEASPVDKFSLYVYFSFTTLTTLGYGDVIPTSPFARTMTSIESVTGQLYLTILVARLVGLHISVVNQNQKSDSD